MGGHDVQYLGPRRLGAAAAAPDELPWASGPLRPEHSSAGGALPEGWPAPGLSFSLVVLRR